MKLKTFVIGVAAVLVLAAGFAYYQGIRSADDAKALVQRLQSVKSVGEVAGWVTGLWKSDKPAAAGPEFNLQPMAR